MFTQWFFSHFYVHGFGKGLVGFLFCLQKKAAELHGEGVAGVLLSSRTTQVFILFKVFKARLKLLSLS